MNSKPYDVVLVPENRIGTEAIKLSQLLNEKGSYFVLDGKNYFPHISLYMLQLTDSGLKQACELLSNISQKVKLINVVASDYHYQGQYIDIEYKKSSELTSAQMEVVEILNPIRDGLREKDKIRIKIAEGEELSNLQTYGYRSIGNSFAPHLTFTRFIEDQADILKNLPDKTIFSGVCSKLAIFEMGDNGTCVREIGSWELKDPSL